MNSSKFTYLYIFETPSQHPKTQNNNLKHNNLNKFKLNKHLITQKKLMRSLCLSNYQIYKESQLKQPQYPVLQTYEKSLNLNGLGFARKSGGS